MYSNILVPIAFDNAHESAPSIKVAQLLASKGAKISILHVFEEIPEYASNYLPDGFRENARAQAEKALVEVASTVAGAEAHVVSGHAGRTILEWAQSHQNDLIVIASHRPGLQDYFLGSTASRVVRHAKCGVHVLR